MCPCKLNPNHLNVRSTPRRHITTALYTQLQMNTRSTQAGVILILVRADHLLQGTRRHATLQHPEYLDTQTPAG